jgi:hypothetical protein
MRTGLVIMISCAPDTHAAARRKLPGQTPGLAAAGRATR